MVKRGKRGISNIEMSIAIILFVAAVFLIIMIFSLFNKSVSRDYALLDSFERNFMKEAQNYTKVGVYVNNTKVGVYVNSQLCINVLFNNNLNKNNIAVFFNNSRASSNLNGDYLTFEGNHSYYEVYELSFPANKPYSTACNLVDFNYTIPVQGKIFYDQDLINLKYDYDHDYSAIK